MYTHWLNTGDSVDSETLITRMAKFKELCLNGNKYIELDISHYNNELIIWASKDIFELLFPKEDEKKDALRCDGLLNKFNTRSLFWKKGNILGIGLVDNKNIPKIYDEIVQCIEHTIHTFFNVVEGEENNIQKFIEFGFKNAWCNEKFRLRLGMFTPLDSKRHPHHPCAKYYKDYDSKCLKNLGSYSLSRMVKDSKKQQIDMRDLFYAFVRRLGKQDEVKTYKLGLFNFYWIEFGLCNIGYDLETNSILIQHDKFNYVPDKNQSLLPDIPTKARKIKIHDIRTIKLPFGCHVYIGIKFNELIGELLITGQYVFKGRLEGQHFSNSLLSNEFEDDLLKMACFIISNNEEMYPFYVRMREKEKLSDIFHIDFLDFPIINKMEDGSYPHIVMHIDKIKDYCTEAAIKCVEFSYNVIRHGHNTFDKEYEEQFEAKNLVSMLWNNDEKEKKNYEIE